MNKKASPTLHNYFWPVRRAALREINGGQKEITNSIKRTPKTSRSKGKTITANRKRSHALQLSPYNKTKKPCFEVLKCEPEESTNVNGSAVFSVTIPEDEKPSCSSQVNNLPDELRVEYSLKIVTHPQQSSTAFKSINAETLSSLLTSLSEDEFRKKYLLVDCRYPFEYNGGHIKCAINVHDPKDIGNIFFPADEDNASSTSRKILIFYCEFSQKRGPSMALNVRAFDRVRNEKRYPEVDYKEMYLLDRGYNAFFKLTEKLNLCQPNSYVKMTDSKHARELRKYSFHRTKTTVSFDLTISKNRSHFVSRCNRKRLHMVKPNSSQSCPSFDETPPGPKSKKHESFSLFANEEFEDSTQQCELGKILESPTQFHELNISGNFDEFLIS